MKKLTVDDVRVLDMQVVTWGIFKCLPRGTRVWLHSTRHDLVVAVLGKPNDELDLELYDFVPDGIICQLEMFDLPHKTTGHTDIAGRNRQDLRAINYKHVSVDYEVRIVGAPEPGDDISEVIAIGSSAGFSSPHFLGAQTPSLVDSYYDNFHCY